MNSQSIKKLRRKFVLIAMASIAAVVIFISGFINVANLISTRRQIREVLNYICDNDGDLPEIGSGSSESEGGREDGSDIDLSLFSVFGHGLINESLYPEFRYATRYFAVLFDADDAVSAVKTGHISSVEEDQAEELARTVRRRFIKFGNYNVFYYMVRENADGSAIVVFVD